MLTALFQNPTKVVRWMLIHVKVRWGVSRARQPAMQSKRCLAGWAWGGQALNGLAKC